jgi:hypothetical protein
MQEDAYWRRQEAVNSLAMERVCVKADEPATSYGAETVVRLARNSI